MLTLHAMRAIIYIKIKKGARKTSQGKTKWKNTQTLKSQTEKTS